MSDHCTLRAKVRKTARLWQGRGSTSAGIVPGSVLAGKLSVSTLVPILSDTLNIDAVGELVGSHGSPPPQHPSQVDIGGGGTGPAATSSAAHNEKNYIDRVTHI